MCLQGMLFLHRDARSHSFSTFLLFFFFIDPDYFPACPSLLSHPARLIQLIFSQSKYENTKINLSCFRIKSAVLLLWGKCGLHMPVTSSKPCLALQSSFVLPQSQGGCCLVDAVRAPDTPHVGMCLCRHPTCCVHAHMWGPLVIPRVAAH